jgi:hypothetical protein
MERRSGPVLVLLSRQHRAVVPLLTLLLLIGGLLLPPAAGVPCLLLLTAFIGWLTILSWPAIVGTARVVRVATLVLLVAGVISRIREF